MGIDHWLDIWQCMPMVGTLLLNRFQPLPLVRTRSLCNHLNHQVLGSGSTVGSSPFDVFTIRITIRLLLSNVVSFSSTKLYPLLLPRLLLLLLSSKMRSSREPPLPLVHSPTINIRRSWRMYSRSKRGWWTTNTRNEWTAVVVTVRLLLVPFSATTLIPLKRGAKWILSGIQVLCV